MKSLLIFCIFTLLFSLGYSEEAKSCSLNYWPKNPKLPKRSSKGRIAWKSFFAKHPESKLKLVESGIVKNSHFGTYKPGDTFGNSWIVTDESQVTGLSHKSAPWIDATFEIKQIDGSVYKILPDRGCGCGGTVDYTWLIPLTAPSGTYDINLTWKFPKKTDQVLHRKYTVTIENPHLFNLIDKEVIKLRKVHGNEKVIVLQDGLRVDGKIYQGVKDLALATGGYEGDQTKIIYPMSRNLNLGYWIVNKKASFYSRMLLKFDLESLKGKAVKKAYIKLYIRKSVRHYADKMRRNFNVYPMLKPWKADRPNLKSKRTAIHVDKRGIGKGYPNVEYQAYPTKWEKPLASGSKDHGNKLSEFVPDDEKLMSGAKADITGIIKDWIKNPEKNYGIIIGDDLPKELVNVHPGLGDKSDDYRKLGGDKMIKFLSSEEPSDKIFSPKLVIVLE
ncbi:MAG: hypothetical protein COA79_18820 [Planctomycetota bacterium]|nr:MAG: hypothetical protein COA79_18820 [Planctomycetota bacterium]